MIERDDLRASVSAGIVTEAQAAALISLSYSRKGARENLAPGDEPFELFKGFNEIFIVVGLAILASGWVGIVTWYLGDRIVDVKGSMITAAATSAVAVWVMSEYFIRRRRMVAPAIALSVMFAGNALFGFVAGLGEYFMLAQDNYESLPLPLALATFALLVFWLRFRVPFAMALIALGAFAVAFFVAANSSGTPDSVKDLFLLSAGGPFAWITLALGALVFCVAMAFDMSDPHRVTRRSANGFWLHVVAAPALVNTVALSLLDSEATGATGMLWALLMIFALVAIVIDRRSFLIAAIGYITVLSGTVFEGDTAVFTVFLLGAGLLVLGALWETIRARLLSILPGFLPLDRLPPSVIVKD
jgi:hypothetical protein